MIIFIILKVFNKTPKTLSQGLLMHALKSDIKELFRNTQIYIYSKYCPFENIYITSFD